MSRQVTEHVRQLLLMGSSERSVSRFLDEFAHNDTHFIETTGASQAIAVIAYTLIDGTLDIRDIAVDASERGRGIGSRLIQDAIDRHSPAKVTAETDDDAVGFYRKLRFGAEPFESEWGVTRYRLTLDCTAHF